LPVVVLVEVVPDLPAKAAMVLENFDQALHILIPPVQVYMVHLDLILVAVVVAVAVALMAVSAAARPVKAIVRVVEDQVAAWVKALQLLLILICPLLIL
jgi:hypothetical protein